MSMFFWCSKLCEASRNETEINCIKEEKEKAERLETREERKRKSKARFQTVQQQNCIAEKKDIAKQDKEEDNKSNGNNKECSTVLSTVKYNPQRLTLCQEDDLSQMLDDIEIDDKSFDSVEKKETCSNSKVDHCTYDHLPGKSSMPSMIGNNRNFLLYFQDYYPQMLLSDESVKRYQILIICKNIEFTLGNGDKEKDEKNEVEYCISRMGNRVKSTHGSDFFNDIDQIIPEEYSLEVSVPEEPCYILTAPSIVTNKLNTSKSKSKSTAKNKSPMTQDQLNMSYKKKNSMKYYLPSRKNNGQTVIKKTTAKKK